MTEIYIGALSGTSADAIDAGAFDFSRTSPAVKLIACHTETLPSKYKESIRLFQNQNLSAYQAAQLDAELGHVFAEAINRLIKNSGLSKENVRAVGCHGQTMIHKPDAVPSFSVQIGNPHIIAANTGVPAVADFRRADLALGGQGAPLTPAFHQKYFAQVGKNRTIINLGGICNITLLNGVDRVGGFDCGPGNTLLDYWANRHLGTPYDDKGDWAATASFNPDLLELLMLNPFLQSKTLRSACTSDFSTPWLSKVLTAFGKKLEPAVIQATLTELTATCIARAITRSEDTPDELFLCGGGVHNLFLLERIKSNAGRTPQSTAELGLEPEWVEAATFAWLAKERLANRPIEIAAVTGADRNTALGVIYTAGVWGKSD